MIMPLNPSDYMSLYFSTGYQVEFCEAGKDHWEKVVEPIVGTSCTVRGLTEGKSYVFKVRAENICGLSEPLTGAPIVAKDMFGKK